MNWNADFIDSVTNWMIFLYFAAPGFRGTESHLQNQVIQATKILWSVQTASVEPG
jgi:hypothetical protein